MVLVDRSLMPAPSHVGAAARRMTVRDLLQRAQAGLVDRLVDGDVLGAGGADPHHPRAIAEKAGKLAEVLELGDGQAVGGDERAEVDAVGCPEQLLEPRRGDRGRLWQEGEDAAAVVV